jgi:hypothetical protein
MVNLNVRFGIFGHVIEVINSGGHCRKATNDNDDTPVQQPSQNPCDREYSPKVSWGAMWMFRAIHSAPRSTTRYTVLLPNAKGEPL